MQEPAGRCLGLPGCVRTTPKVAMLKSVEAKMSKTPGNLLGTKVHPLREKHEDWKLLAFALLLNAALFGIFLSVFTPCYETNDDLIMQHIASGFYTGHPSEYLVFTSVLI